MERLSFSWGGVGCVLSVLVLGGCGGPGDEDDAADSGGSGAAASGGSSGGGATGGDGGDASGGSASGAASSGGAASGGAGTGGGGAGDIDCSGTFRNLQILMQGVRRTSPTLTGDQLELFFAEGEMENERFMRARRASTAEAFGTPEPVPELDAPCGALENRSLDVSFDGLRAYVTCTLEFEVESPLYLLERVTRSSAFGTPTAIGTFAASPGLSGDELSIYGGTLNAGATSVASRSAVGSSFGSPQVVPGLESVGIFAPGVSPDGLEIYGATGEESVFSRAARSSVDEPFSTPEPLPVLSEPFYALGAPEISEDCRTMIYVGLVRSDTEGDVWTLVQVTR